MKREITGIEFDFWKEVFSVMFTDDEEIVSIVEIKEEDDDKK